MKTTSSIRFVALASVLALSFAIPTVQAQDDEEEKTGGFHVSLELGTWLAQPVGLQYEPATEGDPANVFGDTILGMSHDTNSDLLYRFNLDFGPTVGEFRLSWYSQGDESSAKDFRPGSFVFGELLAYPIGAGFRNDGRADAYEAVGKTDYSEFRFAYAREAFVNDRAEGRWFVGVRRIQHERSLAATYYALSPGMPTLIPPLVEEARPDLDPVPDRASSSSSFRGRGLEAGMDFDIHLVSDRFSLETGFAVGALRGKLDSSYVSTNAYYVWPDPVTGEPTVYAPPYAFDDPLPGGGSGVIADVTTQTTSTVRLSSASRSTVSPFVDVYLGLRFRVVAGLDLLGGVRAAYYGSVGADLRPKQVSASDAGINLVDVSETEHSVGYEGLYFGAAYTF